MTRTPDQGPTPMTNNPDMQPTVAVTQYARDAAADVAETLSINSEFFPGHIRVGDHDDHPFVLSYALFEAETLARHRSQETARSADVGRVSAPDAFDMGFSFGMAMRGQTLEDSRAVGRLLLSNDFAPIHDQIRAEIDRQGFDSFKDADYGMCQAKRIIRAALTTPPADDGGLREALDVAAEALDQLLDDMQGGLSVSKAAKDEAINALAVARLSLTPLYGGKE